jgi:hypothetical protein
MEIQAFAKLILSLSMYSLILKIGYKIGPQIMFQWTNVSNSRISSKTQADAPIDT